MFRITASVGLAAAITLSACTGVEDLRDPNNPNRNTQTGALVGAGLGALTGIIAGDNADERRRGAVIGAVVGGGLGAVGGAALDRQEAELRQQLGNSAQVVNTGNELIVTLPQDILFATDSAALTGALQNDLRTVAQSLNNYPDTTVNVIGHTDNVGDASYNQSLSERRAQAVTSVLINAGVPSYRLRAIGRGESSPVTDNFSEASRRLNRRVEIIITPNAS